MLGRFVTSHCLCAEKNETNDPRKKCKPAKDVQYSRKCVPDTTQTLLAVCTSIDLFDGRSKSTLTEEK